MLKEHDFAKALVILVAAHRNSARDSIHALRTILAQNKAEFGSIRIGVAGPGVTHRIDLGDGLTLEQPHLFPEEVRFPWSNDFQAWPRPTCCIRVTLTPETVFAPAQHMQVKEWAQPARRDVPTRERNGLDALTLLNMHVFPKPSRTVGACFAFDNDVLNALTSCFRMLWLPPDTAKQHTHASRLVATDFVHSWKSLSRMEEKARARILLACDRLARYSQQQSVRDGCLEACIALEALFAGDESEAATYKAIRRCARFLRQGLAERAAFAKQLGKAMSLRGKIVHGRVPRSEDSAATDAVAAMADGVAEAVRRLLQIESFPTEDEMDFA